MGLSDYTGKRKCSFEAVSVWMKNRHVKDSVTEDWDV